MAIAYFICFVISVVCTVALIFIGWQQDIFVYAMMFVCISVACGGYAGIAGTNLSEVALFGNVLVHFGICFALMFMLMGISDIARMRMPAWFIALLAVLCFATGCASTSCANGGLFYSAVELRHQYGAGYLQFSVGPLYALLVVTLALLFCTSIFLLARSASSRNRVSCKNMGYLVACEISLLVLYLAEILTDEIWLDFEPFAFVIMELFTMTLVYRLRLYDVSRIVERSLSSDHRYGYIVLDDALDFLGSSGDALDFFPELAQLKIDDKLDTHISPAFERACGWVPECIRLERAGKPLEELETSTYVTLDDGREIRCQWTPVRSTRLTTKDAHLVEFFDDTEQRQYLRLLTNYNDELKKQVMIETERVAAIQDQVILGMATMVESRDSSTGGHIARTAAGVRILVEKIAGQKKYAGIEPIYWGRVVKAAPLHDLGKIAVDDQILRKPGRFTDEEYAAMKTHASSGADIVSRVLEGVQDEEFVTIARNMAHYHHERWDGKGYPDGLSGEDIPLEARIMALADVFDALMSKRCYKDAFDASDTFAIMQEGIGTQFDPELGAAFLECRPQLEAYYRTVSD